MKGRSVFLIGLILSALLGWTIGFLRMPYIGKNLSFGMGFLACLSFISLVWVLLIVWKKNVQFSQLLAKASSKAPKSYALIWLMITLFMFAGGIISSVVLFKHKAFLEEQVQEQKQYLLQQSELLEANRRSNQFVLLTHLFDKIDEELAKSANRTLSDETIERIAAFNYGFKPHRYLEGDSLSTEKLSSERGQLLLILSRVEMDSSSFEKIKQKVSFSGADLRKVDLSGVDLSGIDLSKANLSESNLRATNFSQANLKRAKFWGANMMEVNLKESILNNADLQWAELSGATIIQANLDGANLSDAKLREADLEGVKLTWSKLNGTFFNSANLSKANLTGAELGRANLSQVNFKGASMRLTNLSEANLDQAILTEVRLGKATVEVENWYEKLEQWQVEGVKEIRAKFKIVEDYAGQFNYRLLPIEE